MKTALMQFGDDDNHLTTWQQFQAMGFLGRAEMRMFKHGVDSFVEARCLDIDIRALGDAVDTSLEIEYGFYERGTYQAQGSAVKQELLARKLDLLDRASNRMISQRLGW
jgi:hypothetical protein